MSNDPIVDEVRKAREEYAAQFNFDLNAIISESQRRTLEAQRNGRKVIFPKNMTNPPAVEPPPANPPPTKPPVDKHRIAG